MWGKSSAPGKVSLALGIISSQRPQKGINREARASGGQTYTKASSSRKRMAKRGHRSTSTRRTGREHALRKLEKK